MADDTPIFPESTRQKTANGYGVAVCLLATMAFHIAMVFPMMNAPTNPMDEGCVLVYPELFLKGIIAHRDFQTYYPPGNIWFLAGAYRLYGTNINVERSVGVLYQLILLGGIFTLFRRRGLGVAMAGCVLSSILTLRLGNIAFAWSGALAWAVWSIAVLTGPVKLRTRAVWAGVFAGLAVLWRADIAPAMALAIGGYCYLAKWRWRDFLCLVLAGMVTMAPLILHILVAGPSVFLDNVFITPVFRLHGGRSLPLDFSNAYVGQLYALVVASTLSALIIGWTRHKRDGIEGAALFAAGLFALGIIPQALQRMDLVHLSDVAVMSVPLLVYTGSFLSRSRWMPLLGLCMVLCAVPQVFQYISITHGPAYGTSWISNGDRTIGMTWPGEQKLVDYLQANAKPNESLLVGTKDLRYTPENDVALYHLFPQLKPATYYVEFNPLYANSPRSRLASDVAKADWMILDRIWDRDHEPNESNVAGSNVPNEVVQKKFKLVFVSDPFGVYRRIAD